MLDREGKRLLRIEIEKLFERDDENTWPARIFLSKDKTEELLFDVHYDEYDRKYKTIGFNSKHINKLNLSEVDFEDVSLNCSLYSDKVINLSNTRANIDFSKTYEYKTKDKLMVSDIDLSYVDLSKNDLGKLCHGLCHESEFRNCNLSSTRLMLSSKAWLAFDNCDLSYNDLYQIVLDYADDTSIDSFLRISNCNLTNTGASITFTSDETDEEDYEKIRNNPNYKGCYIEGSYTKNDEFIKVKRTLISSGEKAVDTSKENKKALIAYRNHIIQSYVDEVTKQMVKANPKSYALKNDKNKKTN